MKQLNTANYLRVYAERIATQAIDGTAWETITHTLDRLQAKASGHSKYVLDCIGHARQTAHTQMDSASSRADVYADMELLAIHLYTM